MNRKRSRVGMSWSSGGSPFACGPFLYGRAVPALQGLLFRRGFATRVLTPWPELTIGLERRYERAHDGTSFNARPDPRGTGPHRARTEEPRLRRSDGGRQVGDRPAGREPARPRLRRY